MTTALTILSILSAVSAGISKAVCDLSEEGKLKGNTLFWHKNEAWKNKWKNGDKKQGEKFFGSSKWFVMFTDGWHLFGVLHRISFAVSYLCVGLLTNVSTYYLFGALIVYIVFASVFHIFHTYNFLKLPKYHTK